MGARLVYDGSTEVSCVETFTCPHHNTVHDRYTAGGRKRDLPYCKKCMQPVCELCVIIEARGQDMCIPYEKKLDKFERDLRANIDRRVNVARLLRACGLS